MAGQHQRSFGQRAKWWWNTRVKGLFRVRLKRLLRKNISEVSSAFGFERRATELAAPDAEGITVIGDRVVSSPAADGPGHDHACVPVVGP